MLHNILLNAGKGVTMAKHGRFVNVVLASGTIRAIVRDVKGGTFETNLIAGMAFENDKQFSEVTFISDTTQQTQIWLGDLPLNYSPDSIRSVGASALSNTVVEAFSGTPQVLLPAVTGRNKVTLYAGAGNVVIGGPNLNIFNGIPLTPGQAFQMEMQGAIYALETSGAFPVDYAADVTQNDVDNYQMLSTPTVSTHIPLAPSVNGLYIYTMTTGGATQIYKMRKDTFLSDGTISLGGSCSLSNYAFENGKKLRVPVDGTPAIKWVEVDLTTEAVTSVTLPDSFVANTTRRARHYDIRGDKIVVCDGHNENLIISNDGGASWAVSAATTGFGSAGSDRGVAIAPDGRIYVAYDAVIYYTDDDGATFNTITPPFGLGVPDKAIVCDSDGNLYAASVTDNCLYKSVDGGASWAVAVYGTNCRAVYRVGNTILMGADSKFAYFTKNTGWLESPAISHGATRGLLVGSDGSLYIGYNSADSLYRVSGERMLSGGLEIAVMAEVN